jgi:hypothetical protein
MARLNLLADRTQLIAGHDVRVESDAIVNLSGSGTTIQAINDVMVRSAAAFTASVPLPSASVTVWLGPASANCAVLPARSKISATDGTPELFKTNSI